MGLCGLRALRGLWGFCVREWLGGFGACGVFAFLFVRFSLVCPCFSPFVLLLSFALSCVLVFAFLPALVVICSLCVFVVSFSLTDD